jgi:tetratricopeptide (TPR) repeat protein
MQESSPSPPSTGTSEAAESPPAEKVRAAANRRRVWLFRLLSATLVPALFLCLLEGGLRLFGYGYPCDFFLPVSGRTAWTTNQRFGWQFFPPTIAREPQVYEFPVAKDKDTCRIFILGESAAMGVPEPAFAFGRMLEVMLGERYPGVRFEVINAAMTAINSNVIVPIAEQCAAKNADVVIVYMGNNEVIGPFGPGTVLGGYSPSRGMIRASMFVRTWRTGQLLHNLLRRDSSPGNAAMEWRGMEAFVGRDVPADDPRLETVYQGFRANLDAICASARARGAAVLAATVAVNLKDCAPFSSVHSSGLAAARREECDARCKAGQELAAKGKHEQAAVEFRQAVSADDHFADAQFCLARSLLKLGDFENARTHYILARDLDALRFRADTRINQTIREVAAERAADGVWLVDFEKILEEKTRAEGSLPGNDDFYEHVHLRPEGNYLLATAMFRQLAVALPERVRAKATGSGEPVRFDDCCRRIALTPWNRFQMEEEMTGMTCRPPFTQQFDHSQDQVARQVEVQRLRARYGTPAALDESLRVYQSALKSNPDDLDLRLSYARLLQDGGDTKSGIEQWQWLLARFPDMANWHVDLGEVFNAAGDVHGALGQFDEAEKLDPSLRATVRYHCGATLLAHGKSVEAEEQFRRALEMDPRMARAQNNLGVILLNEQKTADAKQAFERAVGADPSLFSACCNLADLLEKEDNLPEALKAYRQAVEANPSDLKPYIGVARISCKMNDPQAAVQQFRRAVAAMPDNADAYCVLGDMLDRCGQSAEAMDTYRAALKLDPNLLAAGHNLGLMLEKAGRTGEAIEQYRRVLQSHPDSSRTKDSLQRLTGHSS